MDGFETALKRAFAEAPEPVDSGFSVRVAEAVARKQNAAGFFGMAHRVGMAVAGVVILFGLIQLAAVFGPDFYAAVGLEIARVHGELAQTSLTIGLTQVLIMAAAVAGGAAAFRSVRT